MNIETFYQGFCKETFDENGVLNTFEPVLAENFNFAYDVVDEIARQEPDRRAMVWCNETGESKTFTFGEMKRYSDKCAQMLAARKRLWRKMNPPIPERNRVSDIAGKVHQRFSQGIV